MAIESYATTAVTPKGNFIYHPSILLIL